MYFKRELLRYQKSIDIASTLKFDELPAKGLSAGMILTIDSPTKVGTHYDPAVIGDKLRLIDYIDKVQVVTDGKRPLKDLSGELLQALEYWNTGRTAVDQLADRTLYGDHCIIPIPWGRHLYDPLYFLNWEEYSSIELDVKNIMDSTYHDSATVTIENIRIVDPPAGLKSLGLFQERIWREWTTVQDETKYFKPPIGNKLRRILLNATPDITSSWPYRRKRNFWLLMNEIKVAFKEGAEVFYDGYGETLMEQNALEFPHEVHTGGTLLAAATDDVSIRTGVGRRRSGQVTYANVGVTQPAYDFSIYTYLDDIMTVECTQPCLNAYVYWDVFGLGYQNCMALLFDHFGAEHYLDTIDKAPITMEIKTEDHADAAGGTNKLILSELVSK